MEGCSLRESAHRVTEFVTLVRLSSLGQHVAVLALAGYKRRKSALTAGPIAGHCLSNVRGRVARQSAAHAWSHTCMDPRLQARL